MKKMLVLIGLFISSFGCIENKGMMIKVTMPQLTDIVSGKPMTSSGMQVNIKPTIGTELIMTPAPGQSMMFPKGWTGTIAIAYIPAVWDGKAPDGTECPALGDPMLACILQYQVKREFIKNPITGIAWPITVQYQESFSATPVNEPQSDPVYYNFYLAAGKPGQRWIVKGEIKATDWVAK